MKALIVFGTRPEIIKMAPVVEACEDFNLDYNLVHTEQHYEENMSSVFLDDLGLTPDYFLDVESGSHAVQTGCVMTKLERIIKEEKPSILLVEGDTNTGLAAALSSVKVGVPVGHVEAGLRSYDLRMPEEHNRRMIDHISAFLFAPTNVAGANLRREHVWGQIYVTGNTVIDACLKHMNIADEKSDIMEKIDFEKFVLATLHRAENVDDKKVLNNLVKVFLNMDMPVVFVVHPRTINRLKTFGLYKKIGKCNKIEFFPALSYFDFLVLMRNCEFILTDSGGIQEEATAPNIRKPVFVLRRSTEREEAVNAGFAKILGTESVQILKQLDGYQNSFLDMSEKSPYGDGKAGERIVKVIKEEREFLEKYPYIAEKTH